MVFYSAHIQAKNFLKDTIQRTVTFLFIKQGRQLFYVERNLFIQENIYGSKIEKKIDFHIFATPYFGYQG